jgi:GNAT superfamily N-acetyltransferase
MIVPDLRIRFVVAEDYDAWRPLWDGYNAFYGRSGATALAEDITRCTWSRFLDAAEPVFALVALQGSGLVGLAHYLFHRNTVRIEPIVYLSDLYTLPALRGRGVGRALVEGVAAQARAAGATQMYWQTHHTNQAGRRLYDSLARNDGFIVYDKDLA